MRYTQLIDRLVACLTKMGYQVRTHCLDLDAAGRCDYEQRTIELNEPSARHALVTLAHEMGHALHGELVPDLEESVAAPDRERIAWDFAATIVAALDPELAPLVEQLRAEDP